MKDWRTDYIVCEHVAVDEKTEAFHQGNKVCCGQCASSGFLVKDLDYRDEGSLTVGAIKPYNVT